MMEFEEVTFHINKDIKLTAEVAYYRGHPICKTKTVVLEYFGEIFSSASRSSFSDRLIKDSMQDAYVVELVNYLSRIVNGCNYFEVYKNEVNDKKSEDLEAYTFGKLEDTIQLCAQPNQNINDFDGYLRKRYISECYTDDRKFNKNALIKHLNPKFKYLNADFNFSYIASS